MKEEWYCPECGKRNSIPVLPHEDVMSVVNRIEDDHHNISPSCENPVRNIRVFNNEEQR